MTGATGFIGRSALAPLQRLGFEVHALAREIPNPSFIPGVTWHQADLLIPTRAGSISVREILETIRPSHLLHFAWYAEHGKFWSSPLNLDWLTATLQLMRDFAETGGQRFVGAGTCAEYDWTEPNLTQCDEATTPLRPATLYGAAKASTFLTGEAFAKSTGIEFAWGRIFHLFGPGESPTRIVPALIRAHLRGESLDCGGGNQLFDFLQSAQVAEAFAHLCAADLQGSVNIGSGEEKTLRDLSGMIAKLAGESRGEIRFGARPDSGPDRLAPSVAKLQASGWRPSEGLEEGLRKLVDWWKIQA